jgi:hypothetical protein
MARRYRHRPSLLGGLVWIVFGLLFLVHNFGYGPDFWWVLGRYWPVLLILLGIGKILEYCFKKDGVSIRVGEIVGILLLLFFGSILSQTLNSDIGRIFRRMPDFHVGGVPMRPGQWIGESYTYSEEVIFPLNAPAPIRIENSYGSVSLSPGSDREIRVRLKKVVFAREPRAKSIAAEIHIQGGMDSQGGSTADLKPEAEPGKKADARRFFVRTNRESLSAQNYAFYTNMEVLVPKNSQIQVVNSVGEVRAESLDGKLDLSTNHRSLEVRDCSGQFNVSNRYGECRLTNLKGNLDVDGRGKIYIENVQGDITLKNEYSSIEIQGVEGKLTVNAMEGSLSVQNVTKPVVIDARGAGIEIRDLKDSLKLITSHREVEISNIASQVSVDSSYATLNLKGIRGDINLNSSSDTVSADDIRGRFTMKARGSGLRANGIQGPLSIETTLKDVVINNFSDSCTVTNEYAGISLSSEKLGRGDVNVKNRNGSIEFFLPDGASFLIDATARNGKIDSDYEGLAPIRNANGGSLKYRMKTGGPTITLETESSDIHVYRIHGKHDEASDDKDETQAIFPSGAPASANRSVSTFPRSL